MFRLIIFSFLILNNPKPIYVILVGDISCKSCVLELYAYLIKKTKNDKITIATRDKKNIFLNDNKIAYFKKELTKANFLILDAPRLFPEHEKYPYLLKITGRDTLKFLYDSLFVGENLNVRHL